MAGEIDRLEIKIGADASEASQKINDLASSLTRLAAPAGTAASSLKELATSLSSFKSGKNLTKLNDSIDIISQAVEKINGIQVTADMERLVDTFAGLELITESIKGLKVNRSFETNLESLSAAIKQLNEIGSNTGFADGVTSIEQALERLNNIEIGQGFINLSQATASFERSIASMNEFRLDSSFSESIARVARAAEILNDVDFSGMRRMQDVLANMPEGVQISFGSMSNAPDLTEISNTLNGIRDSLAELSGASDEASESMDREAESTERAGNAAQRTTAPIGELGDSFDKIANGSLKVVGASIKAIIAPIQAVGNKFSAAASKAGQFLSSIKRIAMYRAVRTAIKAITEGFAEGRKNLYYYSQAVGTDFAPSMDKAATAALYLKNSIGAATAPLTNYLVPMIDKAVDHIVELINKFNDLTAVLTGASTWTRAIKYPTTWQEELDDANASAKKLKSTMLGFDELNVIEPNTPSAKASKLDMDDYSKMFEEMQTSATWKDKVPEILLPAKLAWDAEGDNTIQTIKKTWEEIKGLIDSVGESFRTVWMNGTGQQTLETVLQIVQNIVGTFGALAKGIRNAWDEGGKGTAIIQSVWNIANNLLTVFRDIWASIREWAEGLDWNPLLTSLGSLFDALDKLTNPESGLMQILKGLWTDVLEPLGTWTIEEGLPAAIDLVAASVQLLSDALDSIVSNETVQKIWEGLKKIGELTFENISGLLASITAILDLINGTEVSDSTANTLEKSNEKLVEILGGNNPDSAYSKINKFMQGSGDLLFDWWNGANLDEEGLYKGEDKRGLGEKLFDYWNHGEVDSDGTWKNKGFKGFNSEAEKLLFISQNNDDIEGAHFFTEYFENFNTGMDSIVAGFTKFKEGWNSFWGGIGEKFFGVFEKINSALVTITTAIPNAIHTFITESIPNAWASIKQKVSEEWTLFIDGLQPTKEKISEWWEKVKQKFDDLLDFPAELFKNVKQKVSEEWTLFIDGLKVTFGIKNHSSSDMKGYGKDIGNGLLNGISEKFTSISTWIKDKIVDPFVKGLKNLFKIQSPSKVTKEIGGFISDGLLKGISEMFSLSNITSWIETNVYQPFMNSMKSTFGIGSSGDSESGKSVGASIVGGIKSGISGAIGSISSLFVADDYKEYGSNITAGIAEGVGTTYSESIGPKLETTQSFIHGYFNSDYYTSDGKGILSGVGDGASNESNFKSTVGEGLDFMRNNILPDWFKPILYNVFGKDVLSGIGEGVESRSNFMATLGDAFDAMRGTMADWFKPEFFRDYGLEIARGIAQGYIDGAGFLQAAQQAYMETGDQDAAQLALDTLTSGWALSGLPKHYAMGGMPETGQLFLAREAGAELVGQYGSHTAVMNNQQIVQAVSDGVYRAVSAAMQKQTGENRTIENHIYLDRQELTSQINQQNLANGVDVFGAVVYT